MSAAARARRVRWEWVAPMLSFLVALSAGWAGAQPFAYVTNRGSNNVSVIDTATNTVVASVPVGTEPVGVAVTPAGTRVYVTSLNLPSGGNVSVIATATNAVVATVPVGDSPWGVAVTPAGNRVYVANLFSNTVSVIDTATNTVVATVPVGTGPFGVAVTPTGARVYVAHSSNYNNVSVIDTATNTVVATVPVGSFPFGVAVTPAGTRVYVANASVPTPPPTDDVSVIDTITNTVVATVPVGRGPIAFGIFIAQESVPTPVPTLSEWGMILLVLLLLTLGTWELAGRPALVGVTTVEGVAVRIPSRRALYSALVEQGMAGLGGGTAPDRGQDGQHVDLGKSEGSSPTS